MQKTKRKRLQSVIIDRLKTVNENLRKENIELKKQLEEQQALVELAKSYKIQHEEAMKQLTDARESYNSALRAIRDERKRYEAQMKNIIQNLQ